ncbi:hypothetical protein NDU88_007995 [Pleurodeles waltl]|uniref:Secreted protein n=1 Tax=Pleurodeles waltl TaxID=8319 RepID=A0AAV7RUT0_PLEWA|nr:hypothetical protein NDU88_007995 [Pleurodeles waltl]
MPPPPPSPAHRLSLLLTWFLSAGPIVVLEATASQPRAGLAFRSGLGGEEDEDGASAAPIEGARGCSRSSQVPRYPVKGSSDVGTPSCPIRGPPTA